MPLLRPTDLVTRKLQKNLIGFLRKEDLDHRIAIDRKSWKQLEALYVELRSHQGQDGFLELASRFLSYVYRSLEPRRSPIEIDKRKLTAKERRRLNREIRKNETRLGIASEMRRAKPSARELVEDRRAAPVIGLGLESKLKPPPRARREEVVIDENTKAPDSDRYHALFVAGWTLNTSDDGGE